MKKLIYLSFSLFLLAATSSCTKDLASLNIPTKAAASVPAGSLFSNSSRILANNLSSASVNTNVFRFTVEHWAMVTYQDEARYDFTTRAIPNSWWNAMYSVLGNLENAAQIIANDATLADGIKANQLAIIDALQVYAWSTLVNTFGNVPYTEALKPTTILFPKYDDPKTVIYPDLMSRLTNDISKMSLTSAGFTSTEDLINKGNMVNWVKFANTLQLRLAMTIADVETSVAKAAVEAVNAGAISSAAENSSFAYLAGSPNQNPLFVDIVTGGRGDYVVAKQLIDTLIKFNDPRLSKFAFQNNVGVYRGGVVGGSNAPQADYSQPGAFSIEPTTSCILLDYVETEFYRAEAVERGYSIPGTAEEHYNNAITASIIYWGGTQAQATTYLANPAVAYATAVGTWRQKIATQKWLGLYNRPFDGWVELRRLDFPKLPPPEFAVSGFPTRMTYSSAESTTNAENYEAGAAAVGGDVVTTKLFWDVN